MAAPRRRRQRRRFAGNASNPTVLKLYNAADCATGAERRELYAMAAEINRAIAERRPREQIAELELRGANRIGLLLL